MSTTRRDWEDLQFTAVWTNQGDEFADVTAHFNLYAITGWEPDSSGAYTVPIYEQKGAQSSLDTTTDLNEAEIFLEIIIKWDGCSHVTPAAYWHLCGRRDVDHFFAAFSRVWDWAKELGMDRL
jgi:hypothetical protein